MKPSRTCTVSAWERELWLPEKIRGVWKVLEMLKTGRESVEHSVERLATTCSNTYESHRAHERAKVISLNDGIRSS